MKEKQKKIKLSFDTVTHQNKIKNIKIYENNLEKVQASKKLLKNSLIMDVLCMQHYDGNPAMGFQLSILQSS